MNRIKVLAFDLDGTIVNSKKEVTKKTREKISELCENGIIPVIASGRPLNGILKVANELDMCRYGGYIIAFNGGMIFDIASREVIYEKKIDVNLFDQIYEYAKKYKLDLLAHYGKYIVTDNIYNSYARLEANINGMDIMCVGDLRSYIKQSVSKFIYVYDSQNIVYDKSKKFSSTEPTVLKYEELKEKENIRQTDIRYIEAVENRISKQFYDKLAVYRSEPYFLEVMPKGIDKGNTLLKLLNHLNFNNSNLMAIGDGYNDLSMIKLANIGVAMGNANESVKKIADYITLDNDSDGVGSAIDYFIKNKKI